MSLSIQRIWIHAIWTTKDKAPLITQKIRKTLFESMENEFLLQRSPLLIINGTPDHVHCLFQLNATKAVSDVLRHVKGSSSHHINGLKLIDDKFAWQIGYMAFAVSEKEHQVVKIKIETQEKFHELTTYEMEAATLMAENSVLPDLFSHTARLVA